MHIGRGGRTTLRWIAWTSVLVALVVVEFPAQGLLVTSGQANSNEVSAPSCSTLIANSTLLGTVSRYYLYPNASLSPSKATAESNILSVWTSVCGSTAFAAAYSNTTNRSITPSAFVGDHNLTPSGYLTGSLFATFTLVGASPCPVGVGGYPAGYPCQESDQWTVNLSTGQVTGPQWSVTSSRFVPCQTPQQNQTNVATVAQFYPNPSQKPSEATAEAEVTVLWAGVCTSTVYYFTYWRDSTQNDSISAWTSAGGRNSSSDLFVQWTIGWDGPCTFPGQDAEPPTSDICYVSESWTADLVANTTSGPTTREQVVSGSGAPPCGSSNCTTLAPTGPSTERVPPWVLAGTAVVVAVVAAGVTLLRARTPIEGDRRPSSPPVRYREAPSGGSPDAGAAENPSWARFAI